MSKNNTKKELKIIDANKGIDLLDPKQRMKYEIAKELGLYDQVIEEGWKSLSAKETGRIGGLMTKRTKSNKKK